MRSYGTFRRREEGQTLFIALIVMFILLVLGLVFTGVISNNIRLAGLMQNRVEANDLSDAGIRYAHSQMLNSPQGADWRGELIDLAPPGTDITRDPDMLYLRPGTGYGLRSDTDTVIDLGGPDGLGPYTRVNFPNGRALVRVRYAPSDANIFQTASVGPFSAPGAARNYLIIESIGRNGKVNPNDPTTLISANAIQFRNYANSAAFRTALAEMTDGDSKIIKSRRLVAFLSIGIIESARFITDYDRLSKPAEIGGPAVGIMHEGVQVVPTLTLGANGDVPRISTPSTIQNNVGGGGSIFSNAALQFTGATNVYLNATLGDSILVADTIEGQDTSVGAGSLNVNLWRWNGGANNYVTPGPQVLTNFTNPSLNSRSNNFTTAQGAIRDGIDGTDQSAYVRSISRKDPPLMSWTDPQTGANRMLLSTQQSGSLGVRGNTGRFGHGDGPYVGNFGDRQLGLDENLREAGGSENSLIHDYFNPGNKGGWANSGWKGQYYIPRGAYMQLLPDGFQIVRDNRGPNNERTWRRPDGSDTLSSTIRYRIGNVGGVPYIINTYTPGVNINLPNPNFALGRRFNGVVYFEGNVRVRGVIPTDVQMTVVSNATIYVEGSITKGVIDSAGNRLNRPSRSTLMLMARDYVTLNTTMFFGPTNGQNVQPKPGSDSITMNVGETMDIQAEILLDQNGLGANPTNPATWAPFAFGGSAGYQSFTAPNSTVGPDVNTRLVMSHAMDDGAASYAMVGMDVNYGIGTPGNPTTYLFPLATPNSVLGVAPYLPGYITPGYTLADFVPIYALGGETWQRYPKFETMGFNMVNTASTAYTFPFLTAGGGEGLYRLIAQETNVFQIRPNTLASLGTPNAYLLSRAALVPHDIRIEAAMYAERGSFVVIPGYWFNSNPNDTRDAFETKVNNYVLGGATQADAVRQSLADRIRDYGASADSPFYAEPLDVRIDIVGAISENMPLPMSYQSEWLKKWGWIPRQIAANYTFAGNTANRVLIPWRHVPSGYDIRDAGPDRYVPNLTLSYDQALATARVAGYVDSPANPYIRVDQYGRPLPPMPRLPVSPTLSYFGEVIN